jgi:hypothetical protein
VRWHEPSEAGGGTTLPSASKKMGSSLRFSSSRPAITGRGMLGEREGEGDAGVRNQRDALISLLLLRELAIPHDCRRQDAQFERWPASAQVGRSVRYTSPIEKR